MRSVMRQTAQRSLTLSFAGVCTSRGVGYGATLTELYYSGSFDRTTLFARNSGYSRGMMYPTFNHMSWCACVVGLTGLRDYLRANVPVPKETDLFIQSDNHMVIGQLRGGVACKDPATMANFRCAQALLKEIREYGNFTLVDMTAVKRASNEPAVTLAHANLTPLCVGVGYVPDGIPASPAGTDGGADARAVCAQ